MVRVSIRTSWVVNFALFRCSHVDYTVWGVLQERVYREKVRTVEELQQRITKEWERLDQRVIDNAVKQWRKATGCLCRCNQRTFWTAVV